MNTMSLGKEGSAQTHTAFQRPRQGFNYKPNTAMGIGCLTGPAFGRFFKLLAFVVVLACAIWLCSLWANGTFGADEQSSPLGLWFAAWLLLAYTLIHIWISTTTIDEQGIQQKWIWNKRIGYHELAFVQLLRLPRFNWLFAPRLYTRSVSGKLMVFYVSSPEMMMECTHLVQAFESFRQR